MVSLMMKLLLCICDLSAGTAGRSTPCNATEMACVRLIYMLLHHIALDSSRDIQAPSIMHDCIDIQDNVEGCHLRARDTLGSQRLICVLAVSRVLERVSQHIQ